MTDRIEQAIDAGAKALHDAMRPKKRSLRWETSTELYRKEMRDLVRPAILAALAIYDAAPKQGD